MSINHITTRKLPRMNWIFIFFSERVSKPEISWNCTNRILICKVTNGTNPNLTLYEGQRHIQDGQKVIEYKWATKQNALFKCTATNTFSEETSEVDLTCPGTWQALLRHAKFTHKHSLTGPRWRPAPGPRGLGREAAWTQGEN